MKRRNTDQPSAELLVTTFFTEAADAFGAILCPADMWRPQLQHASPSGLELTTPDNIEGFFFAECEFQAEDIVGTVSFGDREYDINATASPRDRPCSFSLWEWADALDKSDLVPRDTGFVNQLDRLRDIVRGLARGILEMREVIALAAPSVVERMEAARVRVQAVFQARLRESEHQTAVAQARDAFHERDWERVVALLTAVDDLLSPAERQMLAYARKHMR